MLFIVLGVALVGLKLADIGPVAGWSWWWVLAPFAAALVWWLWADASGLTKKREMDKMEAKKAERRRKNLENLGLHDPKGTKREKAHVTARQKVADRIEGKRTRQREENEETIRHSRLDSEASSSFAEGEARGVDKP